MIKAVIDTNILVSALLTPSGNAARILDHVLNGNIVMYYDSRIITEYHEVLLRHKFDFDKKAVDQVINFIIQTGISFVPVPITDKFTDENDRKFYEAAKTAAAYLVTGNTKHFPSVPIVTTPQEFLLLLDQELIE